MRKIFKTTENLENLVNDCALAVDNCEDLDDRLEMSVELDRVRNNWERFVKSEIFTAVIGTVTQNTDEFVIVDEG